MHKDGDIYTTNLRDDSNGWEIILKELACPRATQDLKLNTKNRDASIKAKQVVLLIFQMKVIGKMLQSIGKLLLK